MWHASLCCSEVVPLRELRRDKVDRSRERLRSRLIVRSRISLGVGRLLGRTRVRVDRSRERPRGPCLCSSAADRPRGRSCPAEWPPFCGYGPECRVGARSSRGSCRGSIGPCAAWFCLRAIGGVQRATAGGYKEPQKKKQKQI